MMMKKIVLIALFLATGTAHANDQYIPIARDQTSI